MKITAGDKGGHHASRVHLEGVEEDLRERSYILAFFFGALRFDGAGFFANGRTVFLAGFFIGGLPL
jgi:hypothetical protein